MINIAPPLVFTLIYRGLPRGVVKMHPFAAPPMPGMMTSHDGIILNGWLEPNADFADVRAELSDKAREILGWTDPDPDLIEVRFRHWHQFYESNGLGILDETGSPVRCESIDLFDSAVSHVGEMESPPVMVSATIHQPSNPGPAEVA